MYRQFMQQHSRPEVGRALTINARKTSPCAFLSFFFFFSSHEESNTGSAESSRGSADDGDIIVARIVALTTIGIVIHQNSLRSIVPSTRDNA